MTLVAFVIGLAFYRASSWMWHDGVLTAVAGTLPDGRTRIWGRPNAQTLGWIQFYDSEASRMGPDLRVHENVHVVQAFVGGIVGVVLFPLLCMAIGWSPITGLLLGGVLGSLLLFSGLYGVLFCYLYVKLGGGDWYWAYRANPFEAQAYALQDRYIADQTSRPWGV